MHHWIAVPLALTLLSLLPAADEAPKPETFTYKQAWSSINKFEYDGKKFDSRTETDIVYVREKTGNKVTIKVLEMHVKASNNGRVNFESRMSKDTLFIPSQDGTLQQVPPDKMKPDDKEMLAEGFEKPLLILTLDEFGKEVSREVSKSKAAQMFSSNGVDMNCLLFHAPFHPKDAEWKEATVYTIANGAKATGDFQYKKTADTEPVSVSGVLKAATIDLNGLVAKNYVFEATGKEWFDAKRSAWTKGNLSGPVSMEFFKDDKLLFVAKGTLEFNMELVEPDTKAGK